MQRGKGDLMKPSNPPWLIVRCTVNPEHREWVKARERKDD